MNGLQCLVLFLLFSIHATVVFLQSDKHCTGRPIKLQFKEGLAAGNVLLTYNKQGGNIVYSFHKSNFTPELSIFRISPQGVVTNIVTLDHEDHRGSQFTLTVLAKTTSSHEFWINACSLIITILDRNDNSPQFEKDLYVGYVRENAREGTLVQGLHGIYATDKDSGPNSVQSYKIVDGNSAGKFKAVKQELSGVKFLNIYTKGSLSRKEASFYVLTVQAVDGGKERAGARTQIRINVEDVNDCRPKFSLEVYPVISVLVSTPVSTEVLKVHAHDCDEGNNAEIYYFFEKFGTKSLSESYFTLDPHTGVIRVARILDYNHGASFRLIEMTVVAQDRGNPSKREETAVKFKLYGAEKPLSSTLRPYFVKNSYLVRIREDLPVSSHILLPDVSQMSRSGPQFMILSHDPVPFQVDAKSGVLYLVKSLDFESKREYSFQLLVSSNSEARSVKSKADVTVLIDDADENYNSPRFKQANIEANFSSNWKLTQSSRFVREVKAIDPDKGLNGILNYYVDDGNAVGRFTVDLERGTVFSVAGLNWDGIRRLGLVIEARDRATKWKSAKQFLLINVVGQEDCTPVFERTMYTANVRENLPRETFVIVTKDRACHSNNVVYSISDGDWQSNFKIAEDSGIVSTTRPLDREEKSEYTLEITAWNGLSSSKALVVINIDDINDNSPVFLNNAYEIDITENRGKIKNLLCVIAKDKDDGENARIKYDVVSGNDSLFHIDPDTGVLSAESLNYEENREHVLKVKATDHGNSSLSSSTVVKVHVKNINDPPRFKSSKMTVVFNEDVDEDSHLKSRSILLPVVDEDVGRNGKFDCGYEDIDPAEFGKFQVLTTSSGCEIRNKVLLKWHEGSVYSLQVRVTDRATPLLHRKSDVITVKIKINDMNNHAPVFTQDSYWTSVTPSATNILTVTARDKDRGHHVRYFLATKSKIFQINPRRGKLTAGKGKLHVGKHTVVVYAEDNGKLRTEVTCYISVANGINTPRITLSKNRPRISEDAHVGLLVTTVRTNNDRGKFSIVGGNVGQTFKISQDGKITVAKELDYERVKEYDLVVRVVYTSRGMEVAKEKHFKVQIMDINDNYPEFTVTDRPLVINIRARIQRIARIRAYDADSANTVTYTFKSPQQDFDIHPGSGEITARKSVHGRNWPYIFTVVAKDSGSPRKQSELEVRVWIRRGNSNLRIPGYQQLGKVNEGSLAVGSKVINFFVNKIGEQDLTYTILRGDDKNAFCVDVTGSLYSARSLDRESRANYILSVSVNDGEYSETSDVHITVNDINDARPQFSSDNISIPVDENTHAQKIYNLSDNVRDLDSGMNSNLTYQIIGTPKHNVFEMDHGMLIVTRTLDHEEAPRHMLTIVVQDRGSPSLKAFLRVDVHVKDRNDNRPVFLSSNYTQRVLLNAPIGYHVIRTRATDKDSGLNGKIKYSIHPCCKMFAIDESTGWISVAGELTKGAFAFTVTATDHATSSLSNTVPVVVPVTLVVEVGAEPPRFLSPRGFSASVNESLAAGTSVLEIRAVSQDLLTYAMYQSNITDLAIDPYTGMISTTKRLDYEDIKYYEFIVSATDRSERMNLAHVKVSVVNVNDNRPKILSKRPMAVRIRQNAKIGTSLVKIIAQDLDNDKLKFSVGKASKFRIDDSGYITTAGSLQGIKDIVNLPVTVSDSGGLKDTLTVVVVVVNYVDPHYILKADVSEDTRINSLILVSPLITPRYVKPLYTIVYPQPNPFEITTIGNLTLKSKLDYEQENGYELTVRVDDSGDYGHFKININVKDENDNLPQFISPSGGCKTRPEIKIHKNAKFGSLVYKFEASDRDSGLNGDVTYSIEKTCRDCSTHFFRLNKKTGELKARGSFLSEFQYKVSVRATDKGYPRRSSQGCILVVADYWNPEFTKEEYHFVVNESAIVGQQIGVVAARGFGVSVMYQLQSPSPFFRVDSNTGVLTLKSTLDYETSGERRCELEVVANGAASKAKVIVHVRDVNDLAPKFDKSTYVDYVPETAPIGVVLLKLHASDGDSGLNADIRYSLKSKEFMVDSFTGEVSTATLLDFEKRQEYRLTVRAHDRGSPSRSGKAKLIVKVENVNDNRPIFTSRKYSCQIWENARAGAELTTVKAVDADRDQVTYGITKGNNGGIFTIGSESGVLHLNKDKTFRLVEPYYDLIISATDGVYSGYTTVRVNIRDINDHLPEFTNCADYKPSIPEDSRFGTTVLRVSASDEDLGTNGEVEYAIVEQQQGRTFTIDRKTGLITTYMKQFDRETKKKFSLVVKATDGSSEMKPFERLEGSCPIEVTITDVNDNRPHFEHRSYSQRISEDVEIGHQIIQVKADDLDEGMNAKITYSLKNPSSLFTINPETGIIKTQSSLLNKKNMYTLKVVATDNGDNPLDSEVDVTVNVDESNDEPQFEQSFYEVSIPENFTRQGIVANVTAKSKNPSIFVFHSILQGNDCPFKISFKGVVTLSGQLDREKTPSYTLTVEAKTISTERPLSANATLRIVLTDVNDCAPEFDRKFYSATVSENVNPPAPVLSVSATDPDLNSVTEYTIVNGGDYFSIDPKTGRVQTKVIFDRERKDRYILQIKATDKENPSSFKDNVLIYVVVSDTNDHSPVFKSSHYKTSVKENEALGTKIAQVEASDDDQGVNAKITYTIKSGNINKMFRIDPDDGQVEVNNNTDYEMRRLYELVIRASDGIHENTTRMTITIENENDRNPKFEEKVHEASILENKPEGSLVTRLKATDPDAKYINYELSKRLEGVFYIPNNTSEIRTKIRLDREKNALYTFQAYAYDHERRSGSVTVRIRVEDENDNSPKFLENSLSMSVFENENNMFVGKVQATDDDNVTTGNGKIHYSITNDRSNPFTIDRDTGDLKTTIALDRENKSSYRLSVTATDAGIPPKSSSGYVMVTVLDANDHSPKFNDEVYEKTIAENASGLSILQLTASDRDIGINAKLSYGMLDYMDEFRVNFSTGMITLSSHLDYEKKNEYKFNVKVEDGGNPKKKDEATVIIKITDCNDHHPVFSPRNYKFEKFEGHYDNVSLGHLVATDKDGTTQNRELSYSLDENASGFYVNPITGELFVNTTLDFEKSKEHKFKAKAINIAPPYLIGESEVKVVVLDRNDNPPELAAPGAPCHLSVPENSESDETIIGNLRVHDKDDDPNGKLFTYKILSGDQSDLFQLDHETGLLKTRARFDRENISLYTLNVRVEDSGTPSMASNLTVRVCVTDQNDFQHKAGYLRLTLNIFNGQYFSPNVRVGQVFVDDLDTDDERYYDVTTGDTSVFAIDRNTGDVIMKRPPPAKEYKFRVLVSDRNSSFYPVYCQVKINVNIIPPEAVSKSIILRFVDMTVNEVVSTIDLYRKEIATALETKFKNVDILSVDKRDSDVDVRIAVHGSPYYAPERLISILKAERNNIKGFQNVVVGYDPCASEPCKSRGCRSFVKMTLNMHSVDDGGGTALTFAKTEVSKTCDDCERLHPAKTLCDDKPCLNSGVCQDIPGGRYLCKCPGQYQGPNCELTTRSFNWGEWVWLRALKSCSVGTLSLEFSTLREDGLLLFAGPTTNIGVGDTSDFLLIRLYKGKVRVALSLGDNKGTDLTVEKSKKLNDGKWHMVEIYRNITLIRVIVDQCKSSMVTEDHEEIRDSCEKTATVNTNFYSLNINNPVQLGGISGSPPDYIDARPFKYEGCIRNLRENGVMMDLKNIFNSKGSQEGCRIIDQHCSSSPCLRNGLCIPNRKSFTCVCPPGFGGTVCETASVEQTFKKTSYLTLRPRHSHSYNSKFTEIEMMIRTRDEHGGSLLMIRDKMEKPRLTLRLIKSGDRLSLEGEVNLGSSEDDKCVVRITDALLRDGQWHQVTISRSRSEVHLGINLDKYPQKVKGKGSSKFIKLELNEIILGRVGPGDGFDGCVKDIRLNGKALPLNQSNNVAWLIKRKDVKSGCLSGACDRNPCPGTHFCYDKWREKECLLRKCKKESPCQNLAKCVDYAEKGVAAFRCDCRDGFNGSKCEFGSYIITLSAGEEVVNVKLVVGLSCFVLVLVLATLVILCYHRHQMNGKATFDKGVMISKLDTSKNSSKKSLVVVEWSDANNEKNKTNNYSKNQPQAKHSLRPHVHNTTKSVPVKRHPLEVEVIERKPLAQLPAWDIPPMIDIVLSPDSDSSRVADDYIEDPDETWQDAESKCVSRPYDDRKPTLSEAELDGSKSPAVTWNDIEEYGRKFYKLTRNFLARDERTRPCSSSSGVSTASDSSSVVTVVENPLS